MRQLIDLKRAIVAFKEKPTVNRADLARLAAMNLWAAAYQDSCGHGEIENVDEIEKQMKLLKVAFEEKGYTNALSYPVKYLHYISLYKSQGLNAVHEHIRSVFNATQNAEV